MMLRRSALRLAAVCIATLGASSASAKTRQDGQLWADIFVSKPVTKGVLLSGEIVSRTVDDITREGQIETRLQAGHPFSRTLTGWVGWVHFATYAPAGRNGIENHAVEQLNWAPGKLGRVAVALRTRFEQRAIRGVDETSWRFREQARFILPLARPHLSLVAWAEPFLAVNRTAAQPYLLERLRSFAGVNVPLAPHLDLEGGYLNEYLPRPVTKRDNHALAITASLRL